MKLSTKSYWDICGALFLLVVMNSCNTSYEEPVIPIDDYILEDGFSLEIIASEPLLKAPVAIDFDAKGRIWVAEMPGYMNDMQGSDETKPVGSIKILEDRDGDGLVDHAKIFLDSLVMPRALSHVYGGLLYAEPPNLWFTEIENDKPKNRVLVDSLYAVVGNPEHQPNGLLLNIDNWIYNAKSNFRYRRINGVWEKEPTTFRGQWGISKDNFGRLYYNSNSTQLLGDHVLPNRLIANRHFTPAKGVAQMLTGDQRVYPLHATSVNRGYSPGVLNQDSVLVKATAACSPMIYRGGAFSDAFDQNAFVCIPEGNLIKRNIMTFLGDSTVAEQAYQGKEFLASTDEGFRPVNLNNGPDGSMYIVDMHRGMIGHHAYLSPYLKEKVKGNRLDTLTNFGRILKVKSTNAQPQEPIDFETLNGQELLALLADENGYLRDRAQHYLIFKNKKEVEKELKALVLEGATPEVKIHALYTLEGLNSLSFDFLVQAGKSTDPSLTAHALVLLEKYASEENSATAEDLFNGLIDKGNVTTDLYLLTTLGKWMAIDEEAFFSSMLTLLERHQNRPIFREAALAGLAGNENYLKERLRASSLFDDSIFVRQLTELIIEKEDSIVNPIFTKKVRTEDGRTAGAKLFYGICSSCHGQNGKGIEGLAPSLLNSEYVADPYRLGLIVLHGLQGPISVNGKKYELNMAMPGLIRNEDISDADISGIIAYVTNAFSDHPKGLSKEEIKKLRAIKPKSGAEYTEEELLDFSLK